MPREMQQGLSEKEKEKLLRLLENIGKNKWNKRWKEHMAIPNNLDPFSNSKIEKEKILRYLLLRVLINQQAKFEKVREMSIKISEEFTDLLIYKPFEISEKQLFDIFRDVAGEKGSLLYKVGALGGIKPISLFSYRFKAYEGFIRWLYENNKSFTDIILENLKDGGSSRLLNFLNNHSVLSAGWVGNDPKACRMLVNWIIFLLNEIWKEKAVELKDTLMIVDGHVGKIFCRTGLIENVLYEKKRPYIIQASKMRQQIESIVKVTKRIPFYVDNGAFYLFEDGYCTDLEPNCNKCPINKICKKYVKWTAYQMQNK